MDDDGMASVEQQVADLADLRAARRRREQLRRGTPEWDEALADEERLIMRIRHWGRPRDGLRQSRE